MPLFQDRRVQIALEDWQRISCELGLGDIRFRHKLIWQKDEPDRSHVVIRLRGGGRDLVLKRVFRPLPGKLAEVAAAQAEARDALARQTRAHAPAVLFASENGSVFVMDHHKGKTLSDHLGKNRNHAKLIERCGVWLDAFHRGFGPTERIYQPRYMVDHIARMADAVREGTIQVVDHDAFLACADRIPEIARQFEGQLTRSSRRHGDLNVRNLLLGSEGVTGLDFKPASSAPVAFDICRLLLDYAELFQDSDGLAGGELIGTDIRDAFLSGYTLIDASDPAMGFLPHVQLLNDWRNLPFDPAAMSWRQSLRLKNVRRLADIGFQN